jgi:hypothetical protein
MNELLFLDFKAKMSIKRKEICEKYAREIVEMFG